MAAPWKMGEVGNLLKIDLRPGDTEPGELLSKASKKTQRATNCQYAALARQREFAMGLDIALGVFILLWAVRGWFKGFLTQAVGLGALVGSVFVATPLRDLARPHVSEWLPSLHPDVLDRLLWWSSALVGLVLLAGSGSWILRLATRRPPTSLPITPQPNRADQGAGFLLGAAKGFVVCSFLAAAIVQYAPGYADAGGGLVEEQTKTSKALLWAAQYKPAEQIWNSQPVQMIVAEVSQNGLWGEPSGSSAEPAGLQATEAKPPQNGRARSSVTDDALRTAARPPRLSVPRLDPTSPTFRDDVDREMRRHGLDPRNAR